MCKHLVSALLHVLDLWSAALDGPSNGPLLCIHHLPNNTKLICLHISVLKKKITWWNEVSFAMQIKLIHNGVYIWQKCISRLSASIVCNFTHWFHSNTWNQKDPKDKTLEYEKVVSNSMCSMGIYPLCL